METQYEPYWHAAVELRGKTQSLIGSKEHPIAKELDHESSMLVEDIEMDRRPRTIEDRIVGIQSRLAKARTMGDEIIGVTHNTELHERFEKMREGVRHLPHY